MTDTFWGLFALMLAAAFVGAALAGLIVASILEGRLARRLDTVVHRIIDATYEQSSAIRDEARGWPDEIVERVDSAAAEQHDQTRRILEHRVAYTDSTGFARLPTVADGEQLAASTAATPPSGLPYPAPAPRPSAAALADRFRADQYRADQYRAAHHPVPETVDRDDDRDDDCGDDRVPRHGHPEHHSRGN